MKFSLYYPIRPNTVNQKFGNPDPVYSNMGLQGHNGIDFRAYHGQPVYAAHDGTAYYEVDSDSGHGIVLRSSQTYDYGWQQVFMKTIYWHLCDSSKEPQFKSPVEASGVLQVKAGDLLGYADNTGVSTGDHLHFGLKPQGLDEDNGAWYNVAQTNGYLGAIDATPYFNGIYAQDIHTLPSIWSFNSDFGLGTTSEDVKQLQIKLGMAPDYQTGYFGFKTLFYVVRYQMAQGIFPITGYVGRKTRASLNMV